MPSPRLFLLLSPGPLMTLAIEVEREDDGRWIAELPEIPGVLAYSQSRYETIDHVQALTF